MAGTEYENGGACYAIVLLYDNMRPCMCRVIIKLYARPLPSSRNSNFEADVLEIEICRTLFDIRFVISLLGHKNCLKQCVCLSFLNVSEFSFQIFASNFH